METTSNPGRLRSRASRLEGLALGEELRAVVRPARQDADGCVVALGADVLDVAHGHRTARGGDDRAPDSGGRARVEHRLGALDVQAIQLLGVLAAARDLAGAVEHALAPLRRARHARRVEHVAAQAPGERHHLVPAQLEGAHQVRAEQAGGAGDEDLRAHDTWSSWKTFWKVISSDTSFDLTAPDRKSAGLGT
jgi:hypothetical protein